MPKYNNPRKTWCYSNDFKVKAVELSYQEGIQIQQVVAGLDIHPFMLSRWRKEYREGKIKSDGRKRVSVMKDKKSPTTSELTELERLKRENARLRKENELLKSGNGIWRNAIRAIWIHPDPRTSARCQDTCANGWVCRVAAITRG